MTQTDAAKNTFEIKSANFPLVALLLKSHDLAAVACDLTRRFGDTPDFFDNDALLIDLTPLQAIANGGAAPIDFAALLALLASYRLLPIAVKGGSPEQMAQAVKAGLVLAPDAHLLTTRAASADQATQAPTLPLSAMILDKPLRSGQQFYAKGRDLIVLSMVNPGAEVIADGNIHVYAPLRGRAIAGANGNTDARIFALSLDMELLSIAGVYRTSETPLPTDVAGQPAQVRLIDGPEGGKLLVTPMR